VQERFNCLNYWTSQGSR